MAWTNASINLVFLLNAVAEMPSNFMLCLTITTEEPSSLLGDEPVLGDSPVPGDALQQSETAQVSVAQV